jgi:hypothetical protein
MGRDDSVDKTQEEIAEEIAKALGHSGEKLEGVLEKLDALGKKLAGVEDAAGYNALVDRYNDLRKEALTRREMLMIHREAIGLWRHQDLDACYPIPPKKRKKHQDDQN